jgi:hypothetical protein
MVKPKIRGRRTLVRFGRPTFRIDPNKIAKHPDPKKYLDSLIEDLK